MFILSGLVRSSAQARLPTLGTNRNVATIMSVNAPFLVFLFAFDPGSHNPRLLVYPVLCHRSDLVPLVAQKSLSRLDIPTGSTLFDLLTISANDRLLVSNTLLPTLAHVHFMVTMATIDTVITPPSTYETPSADSRSCSIPRRALLATTFFLPGYWREHWGILYI
jgi:hypothetical protein